MSGCADVSSHNAVADVSSVFTVFAAGGSTRPPLDASSAARENDVEKKSEIVCDPTGAPTCLSSG